MLRVRQTETLARCTNWVLERLVHCRSDLTKRDIALLRREGDTLAKEEREDILNEVRDRVEVLTIVSKNSIKLLLTKLCITEINFP